MDRRTFLSYLKPRGGAVGLRRSLVKTYGRRRGLYGEVGLSLQYGEVHLAQSRYILLLLA